MLITLYGSYVMYKYGISPCFNASPHTHTQRVSKQVNTGWIDTSIEGRGGLAQELNNDFQQSSQEAGGWDFGCSILLPSTPPPPPHWLGQAPPSTPVCVCSTRLMHSTDSPVLLKDTQATFFSSESFPLMQLPPQSSVHYFQSFI